MQLLSDRTVPSLKMTGAFPRSFWRLCFAGQSRRWVISSPRSLWHQSPSHKEGSQAPEVGKNFLLMLNSYLLACTTAASCSLILIQNFNSNPQTQTHEDLRPSSILMLTHTHFPTYSLILMLIIVISLQIVQQVMKKLCKQSIASCSELNLVNITKNSKKVPFFY